MIHRYTQFSSLPLLLSLFPNVYVKQRVLILKGPGKFRVIRLPEE